MYLHVDRRANILVYQSSSIGVCGCTVRILLTCASGLQLGLSGTGLIGAPSLRKSHVSTGTSPRCFDITDAVFFALVIDDCIILLYGIDNSFSLFATNSACSHP